MSKPYRAFFTDPAGKMHTVYAESMGPCDAVIAMQMENERLKKVITSYGKNPAGFDLEADARRWRYVRDCLAQNTGPKMDNQHHWRFRPLRSYLTGATVSEAVDKAIAEWSENGLG